MNDFSRRTFLKSASATAAGILIMPNLISCKTKASDKLNIALIGAGGRGQDNWTSLFKENEEGKKVINENIVAVCDVDDNRAENAFKTFPNAKRFKDFRVMFDQMANQIDAVIVSTPDHTHFAATMAAMQLGKHVYCEKPLAHNVWQLRTMKKAAKHYGIVSQMGNQGHTTNGIRLIKEWYDAGVLGQVTEVHAWFGPFDFKPGGYWTKPDSYPPSAQPVPEYLDWELWQGPVAEKPYNSVYVPKAWRGFYDYGNGLLGDWACHTIDAPFWALQLGMPLSVEGIVPNPIPDHSFIPDESVVKFEFGARGDKAPVTLSWHEGGSKPEIRPEWGIDKLPGTGMVMIGDKKTLITGGRPNEPRLLVSDEEMKQFLANAPAKTIPRVGEEQPQQEWIDAIKNNTLPGSNFDYAAELTEMIEVGVVSQRFATKLEYDAVNMKFTNHPELDGYIKEPVREGWSFGENLW
ncbi:MAG: Gfo/Idh/MocA family oxidoreductase [Prolixibacteraceae bacterium]|jgi:predicted dehydrogenase